MSLVTDGHCGLLRPTQMAVDHLRQSVKAVGNLRRQPFESNATCQRFPTPIFHCSFTGFNLRCSQQIAVEQWLRYKAADQKAWARARFNSHPSIKFEFKSLFCYFYF